MSHNWFIKQEVQRYQSEHPQEVTLEEEIKTLLDELREEAYKASYKGQMYKIRGSITLLREMYHRLLNSQKEVEV